MILFWLFVLLESLDGPITNGSVRARGDPAIHYRTIRSVDVCKQFASFALGTGNAQMKYVKQKGK